MYIIVVAFILGFTFLSINIIKDFIFNLLNSSSNTYITGVVWFGGLIFLNILIFIFIQFSHYYINTQVSNDLIMAARTVEETCLIVGGGIRTAKQASEVAQSGANWIVTGTLTEDAKSNQDLTQKITEIVNAIQSSSS